MQIVFNHRHHLHPTHEIRRDAHALFEIPARAEAIYRAAEEADLGVFITPLDHGEEPILAVHDADYVRFLREAFARSAEDEGQIAPLFPDTFPTRYAMRLSNRLPGRAGYYAADADSPILEQTWEAAYWSAQCALTAANLLMAGGNVVAGGNRVVYALCRPPGHHAFRDLYGGFCYLNNAAIAARYLQSSAERPSTVAILDIDFHHGNGTQSLFYSDPTVLFCSLHAHPDMDYPYYSGIADERGEGAGLGYNMNWPLARGTTGAAYLTALEEALEAICRFSPQFLIVSAGFDTVVGDPYGGFLLDADDLFQIGNRIAALQLPTLLVQEGGYLLETLGAHAVAFLTPFC